MGLHSPKMGKRKGCSMILDGIIMGLCFLIKYQKMEHVGICQGILISKNMEHRILNGIYQSCMDSYRILTIKIGRHGGLLGVILGFYHIGPRRLGCNPRQ